MSLRSKYTRIISAQEIRDFILFLEIYCFALLLGLAFKHVAPAESVAGQHQCAFSLRLSTSSTIRHSGHQPPQWFCSRRRKDHTPEVLSVVYKLKRRVGPFSHFSHGNHPREHRSHVEFIHQLESLSHFEGPFQQENSAVCAHAHSACPEFEFLFCSWFLAYQDLHADRSARGPSPFDPSVV
jgi:hypothetical protein